MTTLPNDTRAAATATATDIARLMTALDVDFLHLDMLKGSDEPEDLEVLQDLQEDAGEFTDRDDVAVKLYEYPLSIEVRSDWTTTGELLEAAEYAITVATGGPAVRIRGDLGADGSPSRAWLEACDWGTPWTEVRTDHSAALLAFAQFLITA